MFQSGLDLLHAVVADEVHRPHAALAADANVRVLALDVGLDRARAQPAASAAARKSVRQNQQSNGNYSCIQTFDER